MNPLEEGILRKNRITVRQLLYILARSAKTFLTGRPRPPAG